MRYVIKLGGAAYLLGRRAGYGAVGGWCGFILETTIANISATTGRSADAARTELLAGNPQRRFVKPAEVASTVLWLCSPGSAPRHP